jgi:nicotinamide mononucleotide transporter
MRWGLLLALAVAWPVTALFLARTTDSDVPWWDAFPTAASLLGQWLLGRKYVENWTAWLLVNAVSVALFAYKGLWLTVVLYAIFIVMSVAGLRAWRRLAVAA